MADGARTTTPLLIDGDLTGGCGATFVTINPATEQPLGTAADGDAADMDRAVAAARIAFDETLARDEGGVFACGGGAPPVSPPGSTSSRRWSPDSPTTPAWRARRSSVPS